MAKNTKNTESVKKIEDVIETKEEYSFKFTTGKVVKTVDKGIANLLRKDTRYTEITKAGADDGDVQE